MLVFDAGAITGEVAPETASAVGSPQPEGTFKSLSVAIKCLRLEAMKKGDKKGLRLSGTEL